MLISTAGYRKTADNYTRLLGESLESSRQVSWSPEGGECQKHSNLPTWLPHERRFQKSNLGGIARESVTAKVIVADSSGPASQIRRRGRGAAAFSRYIPALRAGLFTEQKLQQANLILWSHRFLLGDFQQ